MVYSAGLFNLFLYAILWLLILWRNYFSTDFISLSDFHSIFLNITNISYTKFNMLLISLCRLAGCAMCELSDVQRLTFEEQPWDLSFPSLWFVLDGSACVPLSICWPIQYSSNSFWEILPKLYVLLLNGSQEVSSPANYMPSLWEGTIKSKERF